MNATDLFVIAAIVGPLAFGRDILGAYRKRRDHLMAEERDAIREPIEIRSMVLKDASGAVALQSALLLEGRSALAAETTRRIAAEAERDAAETKLSAAEERERNLLVQLGRMTADQLSRKGMQDE